MLLRDWAHDYKLEDHDIGKWPFSFEANFTFSTELCLHMVDVQ